MEGYICMYLERESERDTERGREIERETDRQTDRQAETKRRRNATSCIFIQSTNKPPHTLE